MPTHNGRSFYNSVYRKFEPLENWTMDVRMMLESLFGELAISDARIQTLIREKDEEILRLRARISSLEQSRSFWSQARI